MADQNKRPQYCLALSGGGVRSASYSLGVMSALDAHNVPDVPTLDKFDYISSVSGGGYASGYYYSQKYAKVQNVFSEKALLKLQEGLGNESAADKFIGPGLIFPLSPAVMHGTLALTSLPFSLLGSPGSSWLGTNYEFDLGHKYLGEGLDGSNINLKRAPRLKYLGEWVRDAHLPKFIFNASVFGDNKLEEIPRRDRVYEYGMYHEGSRATGFVKLDTHRLSLEGVRLDLERASLYEEINLDEYKNKYRIDLTKVVTISAAGTDAPLEGFWASIRAATGSYTGFYQPMTDGFYIGLYPEYLHHSDGGYSENLGAYSLIKRGCRHLIIVDAEEDPEYIFEAYRILKHDILDSASSVVDLSVIQIDREFRELQKLQAKWTTCGDTNKKCEAYRDKKPGWLDPEPEEKKGYFWTAPVMKGKGRFCKGDDCTFDVTYLKLSFDQRLANDQATLDERNWKRLPIKVEEPIPQPCKMSNVYPSEHFKSLKKSMKKETKKPVDEYDWSDTPILLQKENDDTAPPHYPTINQWLAPDQRKMLFHLGRAHMKMALCMGLPPR